MEFLRNHREVQTLAGRPKSGWKLAQAIKSEKIPRVDIPAYVPLQLRRVVGSGFAEIWGLVEELPADKAKAPILKAFVEKALRSEHAEVREKAREYAKQAGVALRETLDGSVPGRLHG